MKQEAEAETDAKHDPENFSFHQQVEKIETLCMC